VPIFGGWELRPRAHAGFVVAHASDPVTGTATLAGESAPRSIVVAGGTAIAHSTPFFALTELGLERAWGKWRFGASVSTLFLPAPGPPSTLGEVAITTASGTTSTSALAGERTYGSFVVLMPQLSVSYVP
jgi:hypothetical protein